MGLTGESTNRRSFLRQGSSGRSGSRRRGAVGRHRRGRYERRPDQRRRGHSPLPGCGRDPRDRSVAAVQRARRHPGQRSPRRKRESGLHRGGRGAGRGHGPVHPRQHRRRDQPLHLHQRLPGSARRANGQPGQVPHPAEQQGDRRPANRTAHQPDAAHRQHQLLDALPQRLAEPRPRRHAPASHSRSRHRPAPGDPPVRRRPVAEDHLQAIANTAGFHFAWVEQGGTSLYAALAQRVTHPRCCASCSASAAPRSCTSRPGKTKPATRLHSPTPPPGWCSPTSTPTAS